LNIPQIQKTYTTIAVEIAFEQMVDENFSTLVLQPAFCRDTVRGSRLHAAKKEDEAGRSSRDDSVLYITAVLRPRKKA
jgi:hypothetical protein